MTCSSPDDTRVRTITGFAEGISSFSRHFVFPSEVLTLEGPQSRFGDKLLDISVVCPEDGTAVLKGSRAEVFGCFLH